VSGLLLTERGLGLLYAGLIACSITVVFVVLLAYVSEFYALGIFCGAVASAIFSFILVIFGVIYLVAGKDEYEGKHQKSVLLGLGFFLISIMIFTYDYFFNSYFSRDLVVYARILTVSHISGMFLIVGLGLLIHNFLTAGYRKMLWLGIFLSIGCATFGAFYIYSFISGRLYYAIDDEVASYQIISRLGISFYLVGMPSFILCVRRALRSVRYEEISPTDRTKHGSKYHERDWLPEYTKTKTKVYLPGKFEVKPYNPLLEKEDKEDVEVKINIKINKIDETEINKSVRSEDEKMDDKKKEIPSCPDCGALLMKEQQFCGSCGKLLFVSSGKKK